MDSSSIAVEREPPLGEIHDAIAAGDRQFAFSYVADGSDLHARDSLRRTPLHIAAASYQSELSALLVERGADVNSADYRGFTPLHLACGIGSRAIVELLLAAGANPSAPNAFKNTPLHEIAAGGGTATASDRVAIVEMLLTAGAELEATDSTSRTPLWYAAATGTAPTPPSVARARLAVVECLLGRGASPDRKADGKLGTPLDAAAGLHHEEKYRIEWPEAIKLLKACA